MYVSCVQKKTTTDDQRFRKYDICGCDRLGWSMCCEMDKRGTTGERECQCASNCVLDISINEMFTTHYGIYLRIALLKR